MNIITIYEKECHVMLILLDKQYKTITINEQLTCNRDNEYDSLGPQ